jgi:hypothetical protein
MSPLRESFDSKGLVISQKTTTINNIFSISLEVMDLFVDAPKCIGIIPIGNL